MLDLAPLDIVRHRVAVLPLIRFVQVNGLFADQELVSAVLELVSVPRIRPVVLVCPVDCVAPEILATRCFFWFQAIVVDEPASREGPRIQFSVSVDGCKEAMNAFSPDQVLLLCAHAEHSNHIEMRDRGGEHVGIVSYDGQPFRSQAALNTRTIPTRSIDDLNALQFLAEELLEVDRAQRPVLFDIHMRLL